MSCPPEGPGMPVHCRIGSLEILCLDTAALLKVHCRIGSLETQNWVFMTRLDVHCRIGSLEIYPRGEDA